MSNQSNPNDQHKPGQDQQNPSQDPNRQGQQNDMNRGQPGQTPMPGQQRDDDAQRQRQGT